MTFYSILGTKYVLYSTTVQPSKIVQYEPLYTFRRFRRAVRYRYRINTKERGNYENRF